MEKTSAPENKNALTSKHLSEGISPIMLCIDTADHRAEFEKKEFRPKMSTSLNVNYSAYPEDLEDEDIKNAGLETYAISPVNDMNKFSRKYLECTGVIVSGIEKETGKNISFVSHQDPDEFLKKHSEQFSTDLHERLTEIKKRCISGTIDAVIVGGNYVTMANIPKSFKSIRENYRASIETLSKEVSSVLGFEPAVIAGPKNTPGEDHLYYNNDNRQLYVFRPEIADVSSESYLPSNFPEQQKKWDENLYDPKTREDDDNEGE